MFKYETHLHTSGCSACGVSTAEEMVIAAKEHNYAGVIFTNHFYHGNTSVNRKLDWRDFVEKYERDYLKALEVGKTLDIDVFFGFEEVYEPGKEVLVYGVGPEAVKEASFLRKADLQQLSDFVRENGGFIAAAHPFRRRDYIPQPEKEPDMRYFDAIEVYNSGNTEEDNKLAFEFAKRKNVPVISGGDIHSKAYFGYSGLAFNERLHTPENLVKALKSQEYKLIINGNLVDFSEC